MILAYIDPGTGALILQAIIAGFVTILVFFRSKVSAFFSLFKKKDKSDESTPEDE